MSSTLVRDGAAGEAEQATTRRRRAPMPSKSANVKNPKQYETLKDKGMSKERAAKIANTPDASKKGGKAAAKKR
jgi:hypothetical protein